LPYGLRKAKLFKTSLFPSREREIHNDIQRRMTSEIDKIKNQFAAITTDLSVLKTDAQNVKSEAAKNCSGFDNIARQASCQLDKMNATSSAVSKTLTDLEKFYTKYVFTNPDSAVFKGKVAMTVFTIVIIAVISILALASFYVSYRVYIINKSISRLNKIVRG